MPPAAARWLSTPRLMAGLAVLALLGVATGWLAVDGRLSLGAAKAVWSLMCLAGLLAIVLRAKAHWAGWRDRQIRSR